MLQSALSYPHYSNLKPRHKTPFTCLKLLEYSFNTSIVIDKSEDIHDTLSSYKIVISDFSGLFLDCWELGIKTFCLCDDLDDIKNKEMVFDWFYDELKNIRLDNAIEILDNKIFSTD